MLKVAINSERCLPLRKILVSSAKNIKVKSLLTKGKSFILRRKNKGPKVEPRGHPTFHNSIVPENVTLKFYVLVSILQITSKPRELTILNAMISFTADL